jgi:hypothetical protein
MTAKRLLALASNGVARAERGADGQWVVEQVLAGQDVRCLEVDPIHPDVIYAGTQRQGVFRSEDGGRLPARARALLVVVAGRAAI